jgi:SAM-dependent methyltransferase
MKHEPAKHEHQQPSDWVSRFGPMIAPGGRVLDLACGSGRHSRLLAAQGCAVVALDRDAVALARVCEGLDAEVVRRIECRHADVESGPWPFGAGEFDGIVVTNYLHRPLMAALADALRPDGVLIYETFALGNERYGRPSNPAFLLARNELLQHFGAALEVVAFEQGLVERPGPAVVQRLCAVRAGAEGVRPLPRNS